MFPKVVVMPPTAVLTAPTAALTAATAELNEEKLPCRSLDKVAKLAWFADWLATWLFTVKLVCVQTVLPPAVAPMMKA